MAKTLTIDSDRVKDAAETCGTAKAVLKKLFPAAFEPEWEVVPAEDIEAEIDTHPRGSCVPDSIGDGGIFDLHLRNKKTRESYGYIQLDEDMKARAYENYPESKVLVGRMGDSAMLFQILRKKKV